MSLKTLVLTLFWVFIGVMLFKQAYDYNQGVTDRAKNLEPKHYFYGMPHPVDPDAINPKLRAARVSQVSYTTTLNPSLGTFTSHILIKNLGNGKAIGIEFSVRPYRGSIVNANGLGHTPTGVLSDQDPIAQINEMIEVPDLDPGQSTTQTMTFPIRPGLSPGTNPHPEIIFQTEKAP